MAEYKSPITIIQKEMQNSLNIQMEDSVIKTVREFGVDVDKEELIKALQYDRNQYLKGYNDAKAEIVYCKECKWWKRHNLEEQSLYEADGTCLCPAASFGRNVYINTRQNHFCADGEREEPMTCKQTKCYYNTNGVCECDSAFADPKQGKDCRWFSED